MKFLLLITSLSIFGNCITKLDNEESMENVNLVQLDYELQYQLPDSIFIKADATITNLSEDTLYFMSTSCNNLDYQIFSDSSEISPSIFVHCNVSYPRKNHILPKAQFKFSTTFNVISKIKQTHFDLQFVQLNKNSIVERKLIDEVMQSHQKQTFILKGPIKTIK